MMSLRNESIIATYRCQAGYLEISQSVLDEANLSALWHNPVMRMRGRKLEGQEMKRVHAKIVGDKAVLPRDDFERLVELARQTEEIELRVQEDDVPTSAVMRLAEQGGSFDFWSEKGEEIYSIEDGEPV